MLRTNTGKPAWGPLQGCVVRVWGSPATLKRAGVPNTGRNHSQGHGVALVLISPCMCIDHQLHAAASILPRCVGDMRWRCP
jgi:hypothetical protein